MIEKTNEIEMIGAARERAFGLIRAAEELIDAYEEAFRQAERLAEGRDDFVVWVAAYQFQWLQTKFEHCWRNNSDQEAALLRIRPNSMVFCPTDFERLVQAILGLVEGRFFRETSASHDEGVDLINHQSFDFAVDARATTIVQCKLYRGFVPVTDLRDFFGVMVARTATGFFFTTGKITPQGKRFLLQANASSMANRFHIIADREFRALLAICDDLAEIVINADNIPEAEFRAEADNHRNRAHELIYASPPIQGTLW